MKLLVTGGAGFIGSNFIHYVLAHDLAEVVINVDKLTYAGNLASLRDIQEDPRYHFYQLDINDTAKLGRIIVTHEITHIINFAAESHVDRSIADASPFYNSNVLGVMSLLRILQHQPALRLLQVSTDEVYGDLTLTQHPLSEMAPLKPSSPYAASKAAAELMVLSYRRTFGLDVVLTRSANNYGPYQHVEKLIPKMVVNALNAQPLPIYGTGNNRRDWLFVLDNCRALYQVLLHGHPGEAYNVAAHQELTNNAIVKKICRATDTDSRLITHVTDRLGHDHRYAIATNKIEQHLGWQPVHTFETALNHTIAWYKLNAEWWRPLL